MPNSITHHPKTVLGFDFGMKYIGVAVGQSITYSASSLTTLSARDGIPNWEEILQLIKQWRPHDLIVGIPLNMDGTEQRLTFCARRFANRLRTKSKLPVHEVDERLSSWEAKERLFSDYKTLKQVYKEIHAKSAVVLIEQWLNEQNHKN